MSKKLENHKFENNSVNICFVCGKRPEQHRLYPKTLNLNNIEMKITQDKITNKYNELILAVENKYKGETSDGYHTFNELYEFRKLYNATLFNTWASGHNQGFAVKYDVHKSKKHNDGEECFGGGWFIVMAELPTGQISNHYELKDWDLFNVPEKEVANKWDGHTAQDVAKRLNDLLITSKKI